MNNNNDEKEILGYHDQFMFICLQSFKNALQTAKVI